MDLFLQNLLWVRLSGCYESIRYIFNVFLLHHSNGLRISSTAEVTYIIYIGTRCSRKKGVEWCASHGRTIFPRNIPHGANLSNMAIKICRTSKSRIYRHSFVNYEVER